ncbi:MAG: DEAD/DEAH box helicase [Halobacteriota archaeon]
MSEYVDYELVAPQSIEARTYQVALAESALLAPTLIVLPTGLGKTVVALLTIARRLENGGRALFLAPTKPLVEQHAQFLRSHLLAETTVFTGEIPPGKRSELWNANLQVIVSTPQVIENDLKAQRITLSDVKIVIFDEAHRAVGNYAYHFIASTYLEQAADALILGMTASPGGTIEKIHEVSQSLFIDNIEIRTETDPDVLPYTFQKDVEVRRLVLPPEMKLIRERLKHATSKRLRELIKMRLIFSEWTSTSDLIKLQPKVAAQQNYRAMSLLAEVIKLRHAIGLVETQGVIPARKYFDRLLKEAQSKKGSKAAKRLSADEDVKASITLAQRLSEIHPKLSAVADIVTRQLIAKPDSRIIVFTNYRDTAEVVKNALSDVDGIRAQKFVGQAKKNGQKGLSQKEQVELISAFVDGTYNVLVATSVAEEGLDIPSTDMVVFYEPIPSEIRSIQREGRTGRRRSGKVVILVTKDTRDETYSWSSSRKKRTMREEMQRLSIQEDVLPTSASHTTVTSGNQALELSSPVNDEMRPRKDGTAAGNRSSDIPGEAAINVADQARSNNMGTATAASGEENQKTLLDFESGESENRHIRVLADRREGRSGVVRELESLGVTVEIRTLPVADYIISDRIAIERKTTEDFVSSMIDRDLLLQIQGLADNYSHPLLLLEGRGLTTERDVAPKAINAMLAAIVIDLGVPVICSRDAAETACLLFTIAEREQSTRRIAPTVHGKKVPKTLRDQQEYIISMIPSIGRVTARALLQHFGSIQAVFSASTLDLMRVSGIGKQTAEKIHKLARTEYEPEQLD